MKHQSPFEILSSQRRFSHVPLSEQDLDELQHSTLWADAKSHAWESLLNSLRFNGHPLRFNVQEFSFFVDSALRMEQTLPCQKLLTDFVRHQGELGQIPDLIEKSIELTADGTECHDTGYSETARRYATAIDQEVALIHAVCCYINSSGDSRILSENIHGKSLVNHLILSLEFLWSSHCSKTTGLLCKRDPDKPSSEHADITVNAQALCALNSLLDMPQVAGIIKATWQPRQAELATAIRTTLWNGQSGRYERHHTEPDPSRIKDPSFYPLGTALAVSAGLLNLDEIAHSLSETLVYLEEGGPGEKPGWIPSAAAVYAKAGYPVQAMEIARDYAEQLLSGQVKEPVVEHPLTEESVQRMRTGGFLRALRQLKPLVKAHARLEPATASASPRSFGHPLHVRLSFKKIQFSEKRDTKRVPVEFPAHILVKGVRPRLELNGAIHHPSSFGLGLQTTAFLPEGATVELLAQTSDLVGGKPCRLRGRITWSRSKVGTRLYMCGVELDRRSKDLKGWRKFIMDQLLQMESGS